MGTHIYIYIIRRLIYEPNICRLKYYKIQIGHDSFDWEIDFVNTIF